MDLGLLGEDRRGDRVAAAGLRDVDARGLGVGEAEQLQLAQALVQAGGERAACRRRDDVVGRVPVELLDDLEGGRLGALGVERAKGDVGEVHPGRFGHFAAAAVCFVVVALDLADLGAERGAGAGLGVLEAVGVEDICVDPGLGCQRGDGGADVAGGDAADLLVAPLQQPRDRDRDDAVLV